MFEDALENPVFWMLGGGAVAAELLGYIGGKKGWFGELGAVSFVWWQFLILIIGTIIAAAVISEKMS